MQVLCKRSSAGGDVRCSVCGQGFLVYWASTAPETRGEVRAEIAQMLRSHHDGRVATAAHPLDEFYLPVWHGDGAFCAATLLGGATLLEA